MKTLKFEGQLDHVAIHFIEKAKQYLLADWYKKMEEIRKVHENKEPSYTISEGIIIEGKLEKSEVQAIIKELEAIEKLHEQRMKEL